MFPIQTSVPLRYPPVITWVLIAANCAVFLYQVSLSPRQLEWFLFNFALIPARYFAPFAFGGLELDPLHYVPFVSNIFLHGGWLHLIFNMWTLWLFGRAVEDRLGSSAYAAFYFGCGILASLTHAYFHPTSTVPALGASGAIAGIMGCYVRLFPLARLIVLVPILFVPLFFEVPAIIFVGFWFLTQILQGTMDLLAPSTGGGVAWWAHIGGFVAGLALGPLMTRPQQKYRKHYADEGILGFGPNGHR